MRWGTDDCALWCGNIINDALGYDPCAPWRGKYSDRDGAIAVLGPLGLPAALKSAADAHGWRPIDPGAAQVGDIGIAEIGERKSTVVCRAPGWFVGRNETGCTMLKADAVRICWSVLP
jgi:hypothetical protein